MKSVTRICTIAWMELLHVSRDRATLAIILLMPVVQMALFGYAIQPLPSHVPLAMSRMHAGGLVSQTIQSLGLFDIVADGLKPGEAEHYVRTHKAVIGMEWPTLVDTGNPDAEIPIQKIRVIIDDSDPALTTPAVTALQAAYWRLQAEGKYGATLPIDVIRLYNPDNRHDWAITPALAGVVVMISMLMLGALTLVREREQGTWEALLVMPVQAWEALIGKLSPYVIVGLLQATMVIIAGVVLFDIPMRGSLLALALFTVLYALAYLCVGFAISAAAKSQIQAIQGAIFFYLPSMLLSGFLYPFSNMPVFAQQLGAALPLTYFIKAARAVLLQGDGLMVVMAYGWPVALFTLVAITLALLLYRKRI
jgi:ABC-2 type transport system permease protein